MKFYLFLISLNLYSTFHVRTARVRTKIYDSGVGDSRNLIELDIGDRAITISDENIEIKAAALDLLDCLTCSRDPEDADYDIEKDVRRDDLLLANDYSDLKLELQHRGLRTSGDKIEMMIRLLLTVIDPSIQFSEMYVCISFAIRA